MTRPDYSGRSVLVVGSAPLEAPIVRDCNELVIAVNGGISSVPGNVVDVWVLNARDTEANYWGPRQRKLSHLMMGQGAGRTVVEAVLLEKGEELATRKTLARLRAQQTAVNSHIAISHEARRAIETAAGARTPELAKHALSAGLFAVCWAIWGGAAQVRLEGFSLAREGGYAYTSEPIPIRGHLAGDKVALSRLESQRVARILHSLKGQTMATRSTTRSTTKKGGGAAPQPRRAARPTSGIPAARPAATTAPAAAPTRTPQPVRPGARPGAMRVRATALNFYANRRRRPGDVYQLRNPSEFRPSCMERVDASEPITSPTPNAKALREARSSVPELEPNAADLKTPAANADDNDKDPLQVGDE